MFDLSAIPIDRKALLLCLKESQILNPQKFVMDLRTYGMLVTVEQKQFCDHMICYSHHGKITLKNVEIAYGGNGDLPNIPAFEIASNVQGGTHIIEGCGFFHMAGPIVVIENCNL